MYSEPSCFSNFVWMKAYSMLKCFKLLLFVHINQNQNRFVITLQRPLTWYLVVEAPLAGITVDDKRCTPRLVVFFALLCCRCSQVLVALQWCLTGIWVDHSWTFKELSLSHYCIFLPVCSWSLSCWKVNLQKQFDILNAMEQDFIEDIFLFCCVTFYPDQCPIPSTEKHPHSMMLPPSPYFTATPLESIIQVRDIFWYPPDLKLRPNRPAKLVAYIQRPLGTSLQIPSRHSCVLHWGKASQISGVLQWSLTFCKFLSFPHMNSWALACLLL